MNNGGYRVGRLLAMAGMVMWGLIECGMCFKPVYNRPYVQSGCEGVFYARCIPADETGVAGKTTIFRVRKETDEVVDVYDWYSPGGIEMGWSPIAGKVAVAVISEGFPDKTMGIEKNMGLVPVGVRFFLGGKLLREWTVEEMAKLSGAEEKSLKSVECRQVPSTNDYNWVLSVGGKEWVVDILTGEPRN